MPRRQQVQIVGRPLLAETIGTTEGPGTGYVASTMLELSDKLQRILS